MSTLMIAQHAGRIPEPVSEADADEVRTTITHVDPDAPPAEQPDAPEWNALLVDTDTEGGLTTTQLASHVKPSRRGAPVADTTARDTARDAVDASNSTGGHAAAREASGDWGHGTMKIVEGIEPIIVDGHQFDGTYFAADNRGNPAGAYMTPTRTPDDTTQAIGEERAANAVTASQGTNDLYAEFLAKVTGS